MSPRYTDNIADVIVQNSDLISIISEYVQLKKTGRNVKGLCPFHNEKTPSFVVSDEKQLYHCFGCGAAGSVIQFIMQIENLDFLDAIELIAEKSHIDLSQYEVSSTTAIKTDRKVQESMIELTREAAIYFYKQLKSDESNASAYFKKREIDEETIRTFGLGYSPDGWDHLLKHLKTKKYTEEQIEKAGLIIARNSGTGYYDRFRDRVMFPIMDVRGRVIGFGGRVLDDSTPKYLNSPESSIFDKSNTLYGLNIAKKNVRDTKQIIVVEGYMDVISLFRKGVHNAVATLGTALTRSHGNLLKRYADEAVIAYDSDEAGQKATLRSLEILESTGIKVRIFDMMDCKDPDEFIIKYGYERFIKQLNHALTSVEFQLRLAKLKYDFDTNDGRVSYIKEAVSILKKLKSDSEKSHYASKLADEMDIDRNVIQNEIIDRKKRVQSHEPEMYENRPTMDRVLKRKKADNSKNAQLEKRLLQLMAIGKEEFDAIINQIDTEWILDPMVLECINPLSIYYELHEKIKVDILIDLMDIDEITYLKDIIEKNIPIENPKKEIEMVVVQLKTLYLDKQIKELKMKLKESNQNITIDNSEDTAIMEKMLKDYTIELFNTKKRIAKQ